jgi:FKBP-type peptidyl-prolyl cis-trans isomerase FkpA
MRNLALAAVLALSAPAFAQGTPPAPHPMPPAGHPATPGMPAAPAAPAKMDAKEQQNTLYAVGLQLSRILQAQGFYVDQAELGQIDKGLKDGLFGKPTVEVEKYGPKFQQLAQVLRDREAKKNKTAADAFLAKSAKEKGGQKLASGVIVFEEKAGTGATPKETDRVKVNYEGKLPNGNVFDSSIKRGTPAEFPLNQVVPCWTEGLQHMKVGGKAKLVCPPEKAYGEHGRPGIPPNSPLVFEVELLEILPPAPPKPMGMPGMPGMQGQPGQPGQMPAGHP